MKKFNTFFQNEKVMSVVIVGGVFLLTAIVFVMSYYL
jgi:hypothetical protein